MDREGIVPVAGRGAGGNAAKIAGRIRNGEKHTIGAQHAIEIGNVQQTIVADAEGEGIFVARIHDVVGGADHRETLDLHIAVEDRYRHHKRPGCHRAAIGNGENDPVPIRAARGNREDHRSAALHHLTGGNGADRNPVVQNGNPGIGGAGRSIDHGAESGAVTQAQPHLDGLPAIDIAVAIAGGNSAITVIVKDLIQHITTGGIDGYRVVANGIAILVGGKSQRASGGTGKAEQGGAIGCGGCLHLEPGGVGKHHDRILDRLIGGVADDHVHIGAARRKRGGIGNRQAVGHSHIDIGGGITDQIADLGKERRLGGIAYPIDAVQVELAIQQGTAHIPHAQSIDPLEDAQIQDVVHRGMGRAGRHADGGDGTHQL